MIKAEEFYNTLQEGRVDYFSGVPDSLLKDLCAFLKDNVDRNKNIIAANEGNAVALATGYHLATGRTGVVYMQNSGLGNVINPLASLTDRLVYSIPMLLVIGWRGEPGVKDEPQHIKQGLVTTDLLDSMKIPYKILSKDDSVDEIKKIVNEAIVYTNKYNEPYALIIKKGVFESYQLKNSTKNNYEMNREEAIEYILESMEENDVAVSTTGMASREVFELRVKREEGHDRDFLTVGSMGHASQIALAISENTENRAVYCIDGDGAALMHLGGMAIIGSQSPKLYRHIIINNGAHDSVGGQDTVGLEVDFTKIAIGCGYKRAVSCKTTNEFIEAMKNLKGVEGPTLVEVKVKKGARLDLGRPTATPIENKEKFMEFLQR